MLRDLGAILGWLDTRLKLRWALLVPVASVAALVEAAGALAVFGLLRLVAEPHRVRTTPVISAVWRSWPTDDPKDIVATLIGLVALLYVTRAAYLLWAEWLKEATVGRSSTKAAERLFSGYLAADYLFHLRRRSVSLMQEVARATDVAFHLGVASALNIVAEIATIAALVAVLVLTAPGRALAAVALVLAVVAIPLVATRRLWVRSGADQKVLEEQQLHALQQSLGAIKEVKIAGRESFFESRFRTARRALAGVRLRRAWMATGLRLGVETALMICLLGVTMLVVLAGSPGAEAVSLMALFAYTGFRVVPAANRILLNAGYLREGRAFVGGALADFRAMRSPASRVAAPGPAIKFSSTLVCEGVSFRYGEDTSLALAGINLRIRSGESVGIVGPTGSGKSTLVDILLGLLTPTSGRIMIDDEDLAGRERAWQRLVGYVPQEPYLLDETLRRNVAFGVPDAQIDEHRLARACHQAQLDDVVRQLAQGLDTPLGEHGSRLSGGQRQRVAIARALYGEPAVLVFDEATSALDPQTEREVTRAIAALRGTRTLVVIAHRLSTVQGCDRLLFMQEGRIAVTGSYDELLRDPAFRAMAHP